MSMAAAAAAKLVPCSGGLLSMQASGSNNSPFHRDLKYLTLAHHSSSQKLGCLSATTVSFSRTLQPPSLSSQQQQVLLLSNKKKKKNLAAAFLSGSSSLTLLMKLGYVTNSGTGRLRLSLIMNKCHISGQATTGFGQASVGEQQQGQQEEEEVESEEQRLHLDAEARKAMAQISSSQTQQGEPETPGAWKWNIRKRVWDILESHNLARDPRPVHHRIPNFVHAETAASKLASLLEFETAQTVKVNPDTPQKQVRFLTLTAGKKLLTPQPRLRTGFFSSLEAVSLQNIQDGCTSSGVAKYGMPVGLDDKIKVDLVVIGSVAVDPTSGARLGKGEGFAELEYGILRWMGAIDDSTLVITTVHDKQLVDDIPLEKLLIHDVPVDIICTPTQIIRTNTSIPKPQGIYWDKLSPQKLEQIRILRDLKKRIEKETGKLLPSGPSENLPPMAARNTSKKSRVAPTNSTSQSHQKLFMWNIGPMTNWRDVQAHITGLTGSVPKVSLFRTSGSTRQSARITFREHLDLVKLIDSIDKSVLHGATVRAKLKDEQPAEVETKVSSANSESHTTK
ncbi:unnamed protein product [Sphagnum jensenii]|uniref:Methenyltetrahydrofolate synthase domain-containing protein n=1 Tax=Sphagnum jensenii TaxID=128206 RepID=A0ABP1A2G0_9BRYO